MDFKTFFPRTTSIVYVFSFTIMISELSYIEYTSQCYTQSLSYLVLLITLYVI